MSNDPRYARDQVFKRDRGVCAGCGFDTEQAQRVLAFLRATTTGYHGPAWEIYLEARRWVWQVWTGHRKVGTHLWEADHIVPVAEGGGGCGLDNLRTLCLRCHKAATAALAARLAAARREARRQDVTLPLLGE